MEHGKLVDQGTAVRIIGVSKRTLASWRYDHRGPRYVSISSRCVRYEPADVQAFVAKKTVEME